MRTFLALVLALLLTHPLAAQLTPVGPSVNLPAAGCFSINADSFICRSIAGTFVVGTTANGTNGNLSLAAITLSGAIKIGAASTYGFTGVSNGVGVNGGGDTAILASDAGGYLVVKPGSVFVNSATITLGASGTPDTTITRAAPGELTYTAVLFASLGTPANGTITYCSDCTVTTAATCPATASSCVCAGSGTGALAVRLHGVWDCGTFQ
jgi:hypothetical protein